MRPAANKTENANSDYCAFSELASFSSSCLFTPSFLLCQSSQFLNKTEAEIYEQRKSNILDKLY